MLINCLHLLPQLAEVEKHFPDELVIIGVHSAKFPAERAGGSLRSAVLRYEIEHPVVNDEGMEIWSSYSVRAWPTLMFLDPQGRVIAKHEGEAPSDALIDAVADLIQRYDEQGLIDRDPIPAIGVMERPTTALAFPGKLLTDEVGQRLFISDTGHNRIVVTDLDGANPWVIGSGAEGLCDGDYSEARFHNPEGLALDGEILYVADKGNNAIRQIDLIARTVSTIAGTGEAGMGYAEAGPARSIDLRSPWDLAVHSQTLYIAMAGMHQLWALDLPSGMLRPFAGTGREALRDGDLEHGWLAQPSGLDTDGSKLYFVDSETSSVREADLRHMMRSAPSWGPACSTSAMSTALAIKCCCNTRLGWRSATVCSIWPTAITIRSSVCIRPSGGSKAGSATAPPAITTATQMLPASTNPPVSRSRPENSSSPTPTTT